MSEQEHSQGATVQEISFDSFKATKWSTTEEMVLHIIGGAITAYPQAVDEPSFICAYRLLSSLTSEFTIEVFATTRVPADGAIALMRKAHAAYGIPLRPEDKLPSGAAHSENLVAFIESFGERAIDILLNEIKSLSPKQLPQKLREIDSLFYVPSGKILEKLSIENVKLLDVVLQDPQIKNTLLTQMSDRYISYLAAGKERKDDIVKNLPEFLAGKQAFRDALEKRLAEIESS